MNARHLFIDRTLGLVIFLVVLSYAAFCPQANAYQVTEDGWWILSPDEAAALNENIETIEAEMDRLREEIKEKPEMKINTKRVCS